MYRLVEMKWFFWKIYFYNTVGVHKYIFFFFFFFFFFLHVRFKYASTFSLILHGNLVIIIV